MELSPVEVTGERSGEVGWVGDVMLIGGSWVEEVTEDVSESLPEVVAAYADGGAVAFCKLSAVCHMRSDTQLTERLALGFLGDSMAFLGEGATCDLKESFRSISIRVGGAAGLGWGGGAVDVDAKDLFSARFLHFLKLHQSAAHPETSWVDQQRGKLDNNECRFYGRERYKSRLLGQNGLMLNEVSVVLLFRYTWRL